MSFDRCKSQKQQFKPMARASLVLAGLFCLVAPAAADVGKTRQAKISQVKAGQVNTDRTKVNEPAGRNGAQANAAAQAGANEKTEQVLCFAGCAGKPGAVISQQSKPAEVATAKPATAQQSGWRRMGNNLWCHEQKGCRSVNVATHYRDRRRDNYADTRAASSVIRDYLIQHAYDHPGQDRLYLHPGTY